MTATSFLTVSDLEQMALPAGQWELIAGELVAVSPTGIVHTRVVVGLLGRLSAHLARGLAGELVMPDTGIVLSEHPPVVRSPDLGFIRAERRPAGREQWGFYRVVPDFIVEVRSPRDTMPSLIEKGAVWRDAGATIVWIVDPSTRQVLVQGGPQTSRLLAGAEILDASPVVPGFQVRVDEVFAPLD